MLLVLDTNIIFGLLNDSDRLHSKVVELFRKIKGDVVLLDSIIDEVCRIFPEKIYDSIEPFIELYRSIILSFPSESEIRKKEEEKMKELAEKHPRMVNFYKYVVKIARDYRAKNGLTGAIFGLMDYYTIISNCTKLLEIFEEKVKKLNPEINVITSEFRFDNKEDLEKFLSELDVIKSKINELWLGVKRGKDFEIFIEFVAKYRNSIHRTILITDDADFVKLAKKSLNILENSINVHNLEVSSLEEFLQSF